VHRRQNRRRKADARRTFTDVFAHTLSAQPDASHDLAQEMPVAHQPLAAILGELVGMLLSKTAALASAGCANSAHVSDIQRSAPGDRGPAFRENTASSFLRRHHCMLSRATAVGQEQIDQ